MSEENKVEKLKELGLSTEPTSISKNWIHQKFILVAPSKWGKSTLLSHSTNHYFIRLENRFNHLQTVGEDCRCYKDLEKVLTKLNKAIIANLFSIDTLIIDPFDKVIDFIDDEIVEWAIEKYANSDNIIGLGDIPEGNGWRRRTVMVNSLLETLEDLPCAKFLVFHSFTEEKTDRKGQKTKKNSIDVGGKAGGKIKGWADHILHGEILTVGDKEVRRLRTRGTEFMEAGNSVGMPDPFPIGIDMNENFTKLRSYFS